MEKGVCNLIQKYTPEAVRERALSSPDSTFQILVRVPAAYLSTICLASACTLVQCVHSGSNQGIYAMQSLALCCLQTRAATMTTVMGRFFLGLVWDRVSGQADTPGRVQYRAAQLRYVVDSVHTAFIVAGPCW